MKAVILFISIFVSILWLIISQFLCPFIASCFDGHPLDISFLIGIIVIILSWFIGAICFDDKFTRRLILVPCIISVFASNIIIANRFDRGHYCHGYITGNGWVKNNIGITIIDAGRWTYWFKGLDEYGNQVIVNAYDEIDYEYNQNHDNKKHNYEIRWFDEYGNMINIKEFTIYYKEDDHIYSFETYRDNYYEDSKYLIKKYANIKILHKM